MTPRLKGPWLTDTSRLSPTVTYCRFDNQPRGNGARGHPTQDQPGLCRDATTRLTNAVDLRIIDRLQSSVLWIFESEGYRLNRNNVTFDLCLIAELDFNLRILAR